MLKEEKLTKVSDSEKDPASYPSDALEIDTKLDGYSIRSVLGRGAFGITYLATEEHLDRLVAIKEYLPLDIAVREKDSTVHPRTTSHGELFQYGLESFLKEAKTLVQFKHQNIVQVLTYFEHNETAYLVMEYEIGQDLNSYYKDHPYPTETDLLAIFTPVNEGLAVVHQHGFIHRDIKPDNIYIREDQSPVLLDFGAARDVVKTKSDQLTRILTEGYAPYEQFNPAWANQGPWTDIYALGATLYVGIAGRKPVSASKRAAAYMKQGEDPYVSAQQATDKNYNPSFLAAIDKALAFHPEDRPQSLDEWNQMLNGGIAATVIKPSSRPARDETLSNTLNLPAHHQAEISATKHSRSKSWILPVTISIAIVIGGIAGIHFFSRLDNQIVPENGLSTNIPEDLVSSAMIYAKTTCWHYARANKFKGLIEKIKGLPSTSDRTRFIADQMKKIKESENGFEKNFSQYSISIIRLRRYPVDSIKQAIQYFLQLPDYHNDQTYNLIGRIITNHATGPSMNTEKWKSDIIDISMNSGAF